MITDKDVKKLKEVFADNFKNIDNSFKDVNDRLDNRIDSLTKDVMTVIEMVGETNQNLKEISQKFDKKTSDHDDILKNHERRLDKVEDKVFATT
ncbi:hypothetical protein COY12_00955 [Candidatus Roizmanbacteria bacterium CG_4_10_14_0_2_um_filter_33_96]|uniref:Uncharacterized protein n=3 Tax=Candidatus Roizmaniibacteriota TaxID=1752723 RepID=A0A2M7U9N5_9BACT|nr:MAG: hypothetical protein COW97_03755 [Candidatus Roizmanbacteria bacterium CG22_combo_CG10-13_8_21_14_all_34_12]PIZ67946.1 MAG: hypothetical protein COY12_00955 [Candidatus Roizmanbacteria bacterium CG_4_10_14_0_2_um_filter_33_96]